MPQEWSLDWAFSAFLSWIHTVGGLLTSASICPRVLLWGQPAGDAHKNMNEQNTTGLK